jgi:ABC-type Fe3+-siderophore transport system permease subunit
LYFYSASRSNLFSYAFSGAIIFLIAVYDLSRISSDNYTMVLVGLVSVVLFLLFMTLSPLYSNLNKEKEVPERVTE